MGNPIEAIITELSRFIVSMISAFGYTGIFLTMAIESACIPLPSACGLLYRCVGRSALRRAIRALYVGVAKRH